MNRVSTRELRLAFLSCLVGVLVACTTVQTYPGPRLPPDKVATIKGAWNYYFVTTVEGKVLKVDGQKVFGDAIEIVPGKHEVVVFLAMIGGWQTVSGIPETFSFIAEAGHTYKVEGNWNFGDNQIWIIDDQTKEVVAGRKP